MSRGVNASGAVQTFPVQSLEHLDALWIQVAGTHCNLACTHCFVPSGPGIDRHRMMPRDEVARHVADGLAMGVRELYLTGGEPFLHPELLEILEDCLRLLPCTVLTNGTLFTARRIARLLALSGSARYSLEIRVSLDGLSAGPHDAIRGAGAFQRTIDGLLALEGAGLLPIVTLTQPDGEDPSELSRRCRSMLRSRGIRRPRIKLLPLYRIGREVSRSRGYDDAERLTGLESEALDSRPLPCATCRAVTSHGVFVCPLLVDEPAARLGRSLSQARGPFELSTGPCFTCLTTGATCSN